MKFNAKLPHKAAKEFQTVEISCFQIEKFSESMQTTTACHYHSWVTTQGQTVLLCDSLGCTTNKK